MKTPRAADWPALAGALAAKVPPARLHARAVAAGEAAPGKWAVAFSGGADSLAVLLLLWAHWPAHRSRLLALHFNHRLRGRASNADAAFCAGVCRGLGIPLLAESWGKRPARVTEAAAREARHAFFARALRRRSGAVLWLGHHQDDVAETILMRLGRGSGTGGLAAPRPVQVQAGGRLYLRPLLTLKKGELVEALKAGGVPWREDETNAGDSFLRNRIRNTVVPRWREAHQDRDALAGIALTRARLEEDDAALEAWRQEIAPDPVSARLDVKPLVGRPRGLVRRVLQAWLTVHAPDSDLSRQGFEVLLAAVEMGKSTRFSLGKRGFALIRRGVLSLERKRGAIPR